MAHDGSLLGWISPSGGNLADRILKHVRRLLVRRDAVAIDGRQIEELPFRIAFEDLGSEAGRPSAE